MLNFRKISHTDIYIFGLVVLVIGLPLSAFLISVSQFILLGNWLWERAFNDKIEMLKQRKSILFIISVYLIHIIWLISTKDFNLAFNHLKIKLPLLILPLIIGTSKPVNFDHFKFIIHFFIAAIIAASLVSISVLLGLTGIEITNIRDISLFISHIRFSLLINVAILLLSYFILSSKIENSLSQNIIYVFSLIWLITFLFILQSFTGIVIFILMSFFYLFYWVIKQRNIIIKLSFVVIMFCLPTYMYIHISKAINEFYSIEDVNYDTLEKYTNEGNPYSHITENKQIENGHYVFLYLCEEELEREWNKFSSFNYNGTDELGQSLRMTLIRYLSSKGYRKDAIGVNRLSHYDIKAIEEGTTNYLFNIRSGIYTRVYQIIWQFDVYNKGANPSGNSITQRIEYLKTGIEIFKDNLWFGVGTGDLQIAFDKKYEEMKSQLSKRWRLRAHNQFLTFLISFGLIGFIWIIFSLLYPVYLEKKYTDYIFIMFLIIAFLSMLNEDTLETQAGVTFFIFFYSFFLFRKESDQLPN